MTQGWTGSRDAEFSLDFAAVVRRGRERLGEVQGWRLEGPRSVCFERVSDAPLLLARRLSLAEEAALNWPRDATLVIARLEDGAVFAARAFEHLDLPTPNPVSPSIPDGGGTIGGLSRLALRALAPALPWREGTLHITVLVGPHRSNSITLRLVRAQPLDASVEALIAARRAVGFPRAASPPRGAPGEAPFYRAGARTPFVDAPSGLNLRAESIGNTLRLWGALRETPRPRERVRDDDPSERRFNAIRGTHWVDVGAPGAKAVLPVTLVARHPERVSPWCVGMQVPVYGEPRADGAVDAFFGVDPFSLEGAPRLRGPWTFWAVAGTHISEPVSWMME